MITILLAEDHPATRLGLRNALAAEPDLQIIGETANGRSVLALVQQLCPDVLVLDIELPDLDGLAVLAQLGAAPPPRIVIYTGYDVAFYLSQALAYHADGYVLKSSPLAELVQAVRAVATGCRYFCPQVQSQLAAYYAAALKSAQSPIELLTPREREVVYQVGFGLTSAEVAERLGLSPRTVEYHRSHALHKLGLRSADDLKRFAQQLVRDMMIPPRGHTAPPYRRHELRTPT